MEWNYGDLLDAVAEIVPQDAPAAIHGERIIGWGEFDRRSNRLARALLARGAAPGDKVAIYTRNRPEYVEATAACFKARLVHVNVNYRYRAEELHYIFDNSDAQAVLFHEDFAPLVTALRARLPRVKSWVCIGEGEAPDFAERYDDLVAEGDGARLDVKRSGDDQFFIYTGGTTGMPKAVMWRQADLRAAQLQVPILPKVPTDLASHLEILREAGGVGPRQMPACPLMHGTGLVTAIGAMVGGGCIVTLAGANFDAHELWSAVARHKVAQIAIVGDVFAKPMLQALQARPGAYDTSSVLMIVSSGVMWSSDTKRALLELIPGATLLDSFGASEAIGFGLSIMTAQGETRTASFQMGAQVKVFDEQRREVVPGSGRPGFIARTGPIPLGYYKDAEKTARTFPTIARARWSIPGDWCTVEADGSIVLLGRGSVCINSGGEKIYPEEVEEALKTHPAVEDVLVVGIPDARWGQAVTAVAQLRPGARLDEQALREHVRSRLADYKSPKRILQVAEQFRSPNGKADYKAATDYARKMLAV